MPIVDNQITFVIEASGGTTAKVSADDLLQQLEALMGALKATAIASEGEKGRNIRYRFQGLSTNSPLTADLRGELLDFSDEISFQTIHRAMADSIEAISTSAKELPRYLTSEVLKFLRTLCIPIGGSVSTSKIGIANKTFVFDLDFRAKIAKIKDRETVEKGMFIKGIVETMNVHEDHRTFWIYPFQGPEKIKCVFPKDLRETSMQAFGKFVRVIGDFKYAWREKEPYEIIVREIEFLKDQSEITDIRKLWGTAPNATGNVSSESFIEDLRHG